MTPKFLLYTFSLVFAAGNGFKVEAASEAERSVGELIDSGNLPRPFTAPQRHELQQGTGAGTNIVGPNCNRKDCESI